MTGVGFWMLWAPTTAVLGGSIEEARVSRIVRSAPGLPDQVIRIRREPRDESHTITFRHYVEVVLPDDTTREFRMAVDSRRKPYASVNDTFRVAFLPEGEVAFGVFHHRTWAFGAGFVGMGVTLLALSGYLLAQVGRPVVIDPEDPENLERERLAEESEQNRPHAEA